MAKKDEATSTESAIVEDKPIETVEEPREFAPPPPPQNAPPTEAQHDWLRAHPQHVRTSHGTTLARFVECGTLYPDGSFVSDKVSPVVDGNGAFGVGVPLGRGRF